MEKNLFSIWKKAIRSGNKKVKEEQIGTNRPPTKKNLLQ